MSSFDAAKYSMKIITPGLKDGDIRLHMGQPITIAWKAPEHHSRRDWVGIYRVRPFHSKLFLDLTFTSQLGANKSDLITKVSSLGLWVPVHDEEWDGDVALEVAREVPQVRRSRGQGEIVFKGDTLPWQVGKYEVRCADPARGC